MPDHSQCSASPLVRATALVAFFAVVSWAQSPTTPPAEDGTGVVHPPAAAPPTPAEPVPPTVPGTSPPDKRIFGVLPNYRTVDDTQAFASITTKQKFTIATKDSFDWPGFIVAGVFASFYQLEDDHPSFGQGIKGYAHRYVTSYADQVIGNMMTEAAIPSLLHEDPRYFRKGQGPFKTRLWYSLTRTLVTRTDSNHSTFNVGEVLGNGIAAAVGNAYYPDERGFGDTMDRMGIAIATDTISNVLKEFWPDIKRHVVHRHSTETP